MDGLECSEIKYSEAKSITGFTRWDSEYYQKEFLVNEEHLLQREHCIFSKYCKWIKKGIFDLSPDLYLTEGVPFIRTSEIKYPLINFTSTVFLSNDINVENIKTILNSGDLVFTKIGAYIGDVALLPNDFSQYNFSQNVAGASIIDKKTSAYLLCFFCSKYGKKQIKRSIMLSGQGKVELDDIRNYVIPNVSIKTCQEISNYLNVVQELRKKAEESFDCANSILERILKIDYNNLKTSVKKISSSLLLTGRLDAEYYQPKYELIEKSLRTNETVNSLCELFDKNYEPQKGMEYSYIELANIGTTGEIAGIETISSDELPSRARRLVKKGQVIVSSIEGSLDSCALITDEFDNALCSTGFYVLSSNKINSETLFMLFKSKVIQQLLKQRCSGTILTAISKEEFLQMPLPYIDEGTQKEIAEKVQESFRLRDQSKRLLNNAVKAVEMAIETDEESALLWLETQN